MLSTCRGVAAAPGGLGGAPELKPGTRRQSGCLRGALSGEERREGLGVQEWRDLSRYEGDFVNGFKHGKGRYTWRNGEFYQGSFYKDYRHGHGLYSWPTGHKFTGKFYLNRKEGYGQQLFPDGSTFQGLYHLDQRFGPGVVTYPDGRQDVGLWVGERLLRLCTTLKEGFSLKDYPEYAAFVDPDTTDSLTQPPTNDPHTEASTDSEVDTDTDLLIDEIFIYPPGIESYSTDGDHLPLPPGRRKVLDQHFNGELWEPDAYPHKGYDRDPLSTLPLQARIRAHIHKHRLEAEHLDWDVAAVLSLNRESFGPKGPLEVSSELLIQHASRGELQAVSEILKTGLVHPDVADSQRNTALIAATVNCRNDVIQLLLDMGAEIDKLNCEGMTALAVCYVLYYPFQSLHTTSAETPAKTEGLGSPSEQQDSFQISQGDFTTDTPRTAHISRHSSNVSNNNELMTERWPGVSGRETPADTEHRKVRERGEGRSSRGEERARKSRCDENEVKGKREFTNIEEDDELGERRERGSRQEDMDIKARGSEDVPAGERYIQVLDGHIALGSVKWRESRAKAAGRVQGKEDKELTQKPGFGSARSVSSYDIQVTEEVMQRSAEALSRTGFPQSSDTQETVRKMAAMKTEHRVRLSTIKLLLERGADPNASRVPMPVLFLAIMAADTEAVKKLLLCGARTDIPLSPKKKGLYPLHVAAALPGPEGPRITELLLHAITNPDAQACDQDEIYEPDKISMTAQEPLNTNENPNLKEGGRTALHVACQRECDYLNASKVVALLLSHGASTDLLWSGHSPLSLAIASGNDLAVQELLKAGADPSIPLGRKVGSALCALANINYRLGGCRIKLLDVLAKAGADILMPVIVDDVMGTAVDYAHYSFNQDKRIAHTPFHALNMREREIFKARSKLLKMMEDLLRRTVAQRERERDREKEISEKEQHLTSTDSKDAMSSKRKPAFKFCYHCGRSVSVKLTPCSRCHKAFYCSRTCKIRAWERHKEDCIRVSDVGSADVVRKSAVSKSSKGPKPSSVKLKSHSASKPLSMAENVLEGGTKMKGNYSFN